MKEAVAIRGEVTPGLRVKLKTWRIALLILGAAVAPSVFSSTSVAASVPAPARLLPDDTLLVITVPDFAKMKSLHQKSPQALFWNDPAMKAFKDNFLSHWREELVVPLERELNIHFADFTNLLQGQLTLAVTRNGWQGSDDNSPGVLLLLDSKENSAQLKKTLSDLRRKWVDAGKTIRTEKIRDYEFYVLPISTNDIPKALRKLFPKPLPVQEAGAQQDEPKKTIPKTEVIVGQVDSLLVVGSSLKAAEKIVARLAGSSMPALGETAAYQASYQSLFRDAPLYGWINAKSLIDLFIRRANEKKENPDAPNPFDVSPEKIVGAIGLGGLKTIAFDLKESNEGALFQLVFGVPEAGRQGVFKILAGEQKETSVPPFVPADAVKFQRWRLDGQKAWASVEKIITDINPQWLNGINFLLDTANTAAKEKDPGFDIKKDLIGNLGDDMISYEKAPRGTTAAELNSPPSLFLLGSPNGEQLASALKNVLVFLGQQAGSPSEREFLGRKIFSVPLPALPLPGASTTTGRTRTLSYAASGGYVTMSTDPSVLEEYLRSSESQAKSLRETAGLQDAAQKVTGPGTSLFGYENQMETMRAKFEAFRKNPSSFKNNAAGLAALSALGFSSPAQSLSDWLDPSLLPPFDKVARYFGFSVYGGGANVDGWTFKMFFPTPSQLRTAQSSASAH